MHQYLQRDFLNKDPGPTFQDIWGHMGASLVPKVRAKVFPSFATSPPPLVQLPGLSNSHPERNSTKKFKNHLKTKIFLHPGLARKNAYHPQKLNNLAGSVDTLRCPAKGCAPKPRFATAFHCTRKQSDSSMWFGHFHCTHRVGFGSDTIVRTPLPGGGRPAGGTQTTLSLHGKPLSPPGNRTVHTRKKWL